MVVADMQIRATDARGTDADHDLARIGVPEWHIPKHEGGVTRGGLDQADHDGHSTMTFMTEPARIFATAAGTSPGAITSLTRDASVVWSAARVRTASSMSSGR